MSINTSKNTYIPTLAKNWQISEQFFESDEINKLGTELGVSSWLIELLLKRGLKSLAELDFFLSPNLRYLYPPKTWYGVEDCAKILVTELRKGKKMAVWGDYDVDGLTGVALAVEVLNFHGFEVITYIPHRLDEGYGLSRAGVENLAEQGVLLLLTVDCGISDHDSVQRANELGMTVIISDHHLPGKSLPEASGICNPKLERINTIGFKSLAGVGVAFFLLAEINNLLTEQGKERFDMRKVLDLVSLGTIADMVELCDQNRILVKNGLLLLAEAKRPGIAALKKVSGYSPTSRLETGQVGFGLAPRLNAAGRLGKADLALALLLTKDHAEAEKLSVCLDAMNKQRREEEDRILAEAKEQALAKSSLHSLILYGRDWHSGVIGIVASRIVELFYKPTIIFCSENGFAKGSGRSIAEFDLHASLSKCQDLFLRFGGHKQAAGVSLELNNLEIFMSRFNELTENELGKEQILPTLHIDTELGFNLASDYTFLKELELMQPFGIGNAEPNFISPPVLIQNIKHFGQNHVNLDLLDQQSNISLNAKVWRKADDFPLTGCGRYLKIIYCPKLDMYNGIPNIVLKIKDWRWLPL